MPKTVQIRDLDDDLYAALQRHAAFSGVSVPEYIRRELTRIAARPSIEEWLERVSRRPDTNITTADTIAALDEMRGPWPDADH